MSDQSKVDLQEDQGTAVRETILKALVAHPLSGFEIALWAERINGVQGTSFERMLYPVLHRLVADGVLQVRTEGQPPRRIYALAEGGKREQTKNEQKSWQLRTHHG